MSLPTQLHDLSVVELAALLRARKVSAIETTQHFLARAEAHATLGTYLAIDPAVSLRQAANADARLANGTAGTLEGVPMAHKDIFVTKDFPT
ncbi:MAG: amidase family protein, partial [Polaromonas sp.]